MVRITRSRGPAAHQASSITLQSRSFVASGVYQRASRGGSRAQTGLFFLIVSLIAGVLGFTGVAMAAAGIAKILFFIFLALFVIVLAVGMLLGAALF
jgi:uncharacterized membrane protein YtjA (UPF0391 family)